MNKMNIPNSWEDVSFSKYLELVELESDFSNAVTESEYSIKIISIITGYSIDSIKGLRMNDFIALNKHLQFLSEGHKPSKNKLSIKNIEDITYDDFITYENLKKNPESNLAAILSLMSAEGLTEEQIKNKSTAEVLDGFFQLRLMLVNYMVDSHQSLIKQNLKKHKEILTKQLFQSFKKKLNPINLFTKKNMDGSN